MIGRHPGGSDRVGLVAHPRAAEAAAAPLGRWASATQKYLKFESQEPGPGSGSGAGKTMAFDREKLDVYQLAIEFVAKANDIIERLPRGRGYLADQLQRAALSIVLNIAEGAGKFSPA